MAYAFSSDQELLHLLRQDDRAAFMEIYQRYKNLLQSHICKKLGSFEETKDILQDTFATLWLKRNELPDTANLSGYLYVIARNKIFNQFSRKESQDKYIRSVQAYIDAGEFITDNTVRERELMALIEKEIATLPAKMREVFILSRNAGHTHREIAEQLGITEQTVSKQITNALKLLRVKLGATISVFLIILLK